MTQVTLSPAWVVAVLATTLFLGYLAMRGHIKAILLADELRIVRDAARKANAPVAEANNQTEHWIRVAREGDRLAKGSVTLDAKTKQLVALAVHNENANEAAAAALAVCRRLAKEEE